NRRSLPFGQPLLRANRGPRREHRASGGLHGDGRLVAPGPRRRSGETPGRRERQADSIVSRGHRSCRCGGSCTERRLGPSMRETQKTLADEGWELRKISRGADEETHQAEFALK